MIIDVQGKSYENHNFLVVEPLRGGGEENYCRWKEKYEPLWSWGRVPDP